MGESARQAWSRALSLMICGAVLALGGRATPAGATIKYGVLQLSGNVESRELIRHSSYDRFQFVQNRNTFRLRVDWDWLQNGKLLDKFDIPFIERSKVFLLYRGVYDGFYDIGTGDRQHGQTREDDLVGGRITDFSGDTRDNMKYENRLREAYVDFKLKDAPLSFRVGRQQVIWGESDQFRLMDIWNPLDVTWHFQQESWDNIRVPLWLAKGLWDIGEIGPFSNTFMEVVYNPFDFQPGIKAGFLPQPWALPFPDPLRRGQVQVASANVTPVFHLGNTSLKQGDFKRNPADASEVGVRLHSVTPQGIEFAMNYLYARGRGVGAASPFAVKINRINFDQRCNAAGQCGTFPPRDGTEVGIYQPDINDPTYNYKVFPIDVYADVVHPYMHIFGLTGNYFEGTFTSAVLRFETAYAMGEPFQTKDPSKRVPITRGTDPQNYQYDIMGFSPLGFTKRDVWAGMIGFDRPTWIRWLNSKSTWFLTGQFFWNYTTGGNIDWLVGNAGAGDPPYYGPIGVWKTGPYAGRLERQQTGNTTTVDNSYLGAPNDPSAIGNGDNIRQWEHLITIAGTSFYRGGTVVPFIANAWDPVNMNNEFLWNLDYYFSNDLIFTVEQKFFTSFNRGAPSNDPWYAGGRFTRRDETGIKITYQF